MSIVALKQVWVEANFKEGQLQRIRIGQPVTLAADVYGKRVEFHGKIEGLGAGTGAAFALLPAQNATGNWIKVVQRVPVRVSLDPKEVAEHPLRVGLSMEARVDVSLQDGKMLADAQRAPVVAQTTVYDQVNRDAADEVRKIIAANLGRPAAVAAAAVLPKAAPRQVTREAPQAVPPASAALAAARPATAVK
jgi:membrane fusion protein (multidrug efflux system)